MGGVRGPDARVPDVTESTDSARTSAHDGAMSYRIRLGLMALAFVAASPLWAHCDGMDGPVVHAAMKALDTGRIDHILIWVRAADEPEVRAAFEKTVAVRKLGPDARGLADRYFFETVVRVHRAGEGEPYTGLKPAGRDLGPAIPAADKAIATGSADAVIELVTHAARHGIVERFARVMSAKEAAAEDVTHGRDYVGAYVQFLHYIEGLHTAAAGHTGEAPRIPAGHQHP